MAALSNYQLRSKGDKRYTVNVANCTREHAESVLVSVRDAIGCPDDLTLHEVDDLYGTPRRRRWWGWLNRG